MASLPNIAALFVAKNGCYFNLPNVDPWDQERAARLYKGPHPVVGHPPCQHWGQLAHINFKRWGGEHNRPGNDGGCFISALDSLQRYGGVIEHPGFSNAWETYGLPRPEIGRWAFKGGYWVCEVWQVAYGHLANKRTWLLYHGRNAPPSLGCWNIDRWPVGSHQIGGRSSNKNITNKPSIMGKAASATPIKFRDTLIALARGSMQ